MILDLRNKGDKEMTHHTKLVAELIALDKKESTKKGYNPFAIGLYLEAAQDVTDAESFADNFTATRGMHKVAKNMGYALDVERGNWIIRQ